MILRILTLFMAVLVAALFAMIGFFLSRLIAGGNLWISVTGITLTASITVYMIRRMLRKAKTLRSTSRHIKGRL